MTIEHASITRIIIESPKYYPSLPTHFRFYNETPADIMRMISEIYNAGIDDTMNSISDFWASVSGQRVHDSETSLHLITNRGRDYLHPQEYTRSES